MTQFSLQSRYLHRKGGKLLRDNGSSYVATDLADNLEGKGMDRVRGAPHHPQTQGKIPLIAASSDCWAAERWHQTMNNRVLLENYFLPGDLERQIGAFFAKYNGAVLAERQASKPELPASSRLLWSSARPAKRSWEFAWSYIMFEDNSQPKPEVRILGQFVRDLSFENIMAQTGGGDETQPNVQMQVSVDARKLQGEHRFQSSVKLKISSKGHSTDKVLFLLDVDYVGVFQVKNIPEDQLEPILMIECPRLIFPFLRRVVSDMTRDGGFPPLNLENIDFMALYRKEVARSQPEQQPRADA